MAAPIAPCINNAIFRVSSFDDVGLLEVLVVNKRRLGGVDVGLWNLIKANVSVDICHICCNFSESLRS